MTIKRCMNCSDPFSTRIVKLDNFCSNKCKIEFNNKLININKISDTQAEMEFKAKQKEKDKDWRLSRRRILR